ncbi:hypothetical protein [Paraburkholderia sp. ZP32-5]|uniref:hypothetical protein n=1 Tax=Paraburkholderia sp. ZP32-5 TaxID=2883245 RepID=UPI001F3BBB8D|nr:hypothetical protein [Paraburkholderia sp. ZP32-5]
MQELVKLAIEAHGGLERWAQIRQISAAFTASGLGFKQRGPNGEAVAALPMRVIVDAREQKTIFEPFAAVDQRGVYRPRRTAIESFDGKLVEALDDPRESLKQLASGSAWSTPQVLYFLGYSLWMYLTLPYSFLHDGMQCEEIEPLAQGDETWRALQVTYPASYPSHSTQQIHYFDDNGLMRRQDYTVDVRQNLGAAHYIDGHRNIDGLVFPTRRRIYARGPDGGPRKDKLLISADFDDFELIRAAS